MTDPNHTLAGIPPDQPTIHWILTRRGQSVICESHPTPTGFDLVLLLAGHATEQQICGACPGTLERWRDPVPCLRLGGRLIADLPNRRNSED